MFVLGRWRIGVCALLALAVTIAGSIGGAVPPADAEVVPAGAPPTALNVSAAAAATGGQVEALALARFGAGGQRGLTVPAPSAVPVSPTVANASLENASAVRFARPPGLVPAAPIEEEVVSVGDPSEFDAIEQELLDRVKEASVDTVKRPGFDVWPGFGQLQLVGLNTWFKVDDEAWVEDVEVYQELSFERLTAIGDPERVEYEFADGIRFCRRQGVEYSTAADRSLSCSRGWEHTTEVEPQRVRARLVYEFEWELAEEVDGSGDRQITAAGDYLIVGEWSEWRDLIVGELGTVASDGTGASQTRPDREGGVETLEAVVEDNSCGFNIFCHGARAAVAIWKWGAEAWDALSSGLLDVAHTIWNLARGCFANVVDVFIALKDMISKVRALHDDPVGFIKQQIEVIRQMKEALWEDPQAFILELAGGAIEYDLYQSNPEQWIGKFGCQLAVALFTGGGSLFAKFGSAARLVEKITDFLASRGRTGRLDADALPDGPRRDRDGREDDNPEEGENLEPPPNCRIGNSFPTGTQVRTADGSLVPIQLIRPGDRVLAADPETGEWSSQLVLDRWSHLDDGQMVTAVLADGSRVTATDHHEFWVASDGAWLQLEDVTAGDLFLTPVGLTPVASVIRHPIAETLVWELDTTGPDTFTVNTGSVDVLVHNECFALGKTNRQSRDLTEAEINHTFDRHGWELLNIPEHALRRDLHFDAVKDIIDRARQSGLTFRSRSGGSETIAHLARIDGEYVVVHFFADGPDAGSLASAWRPTGDQLTRYLEQASRQGP